MSSWMMAAALNGKRSQLAYHAIRERILRGTLPPGTPLARRTLAQELGISTLPVAEALQQLENEGLVESRPRVGTRVTVPTPESMLGVYLIREALEVQSARLFAARASARDRARMKRAAAELDARYANPENARNKDYNYQTGQLHVFFHLRIAECGGVKAIAQALEKSHTLIANVFFMTSAHVLNLPARWHSELIEALAQSDVELADRAMRRHCQYLVEETMRRLAPAANTRNLAKGSYRRPYKKRGPQDAGSGPRHLPESQV